VLQQVVNGLTLGVVYALIGMGFSMVWATARTMNFAYGVTYTLGAYTLYVALDVMFHDGDASVGLLFTVFALAAIIGVLMGWGLERIVFRPLRESEMAPFFASLGVAIIVENLLIISFGSRAQSLSVSATSSFVDVGSVRVTAAQIGVLVASVAIMAALQYTVSRTAFGRAMRATAWNRTTTRLMGVDPNRVIAMVFIVASVLALWSGVFVGLFYGSASPYMGTEVLVKGLAAAVLGGFGYLPGAIVGGLLVGLVEAMGAQLTTSGNWPDVMAYGVMILVILLRPQGLLTGKGAVT
jgi:branched-chain amino acid transport system permease protein